MSIVKLLDDYLLEHGNKRFIEGWDGAIESVVTELEYKRKRAIENSQGVTESMYMQYVGLIRGLEVAIEVIVKRTN